jgi:hypothetical protein
MQIMTTKKDPAAVKLGRKGGLATAAKLTKAKRAQSARNAAAARWKDHEYSKEASARSHRKRRQKSSK